MLESWGMTVGEMILLVTTIFTALMSTLTVVLIRIVTQQVAIVHEQTNSRLSRISDELSTTKATLAATVLALASARILQQPDVDRGTTPDP